MTVQANPVVDPANPADPIVDPANPNPADPIVEPGKKAAATVPLTDFQRMQADMHKFKTRAAELEREKTELETNKMKANNQWKELAEAKENEAKGLKERLDNLSGALVTDRKESAVRSACEKLGIRPEALSDLEMLDLEQLQVETTSTGKMNVLGADQFAERLKTTKPHWFKELSDPTNVNTTIPRTTPTTGPITIDMVMAADTESRKTGDTSKYVSLLKKYQEQRRQRR